MNMKKLFFTLFVMAIGVVAVNAQDKNGPQFKFDDVTHDFGTIPEGPQAEYYFEFTNVGSEPLIIQNATASCGCTTPEVPRQPILPEQKGKIKVVYNTQGRVGPFNKEIYIQSNAVNNGEGKERFELYIKGTVKSATEK